MRSGTAEHPPTFEVTTSVTSPYRGDQFLHFTYKVAKIKIQGFISRFASSILLILLSMLIARNPLYKKGHTGRIFELNFRTQE